MAEVCNLTVAESMWLEQQVEKEVMKNFAEEVDKQVEDAEVGILLIFRMAEVCNLTVAESMWLEQQVEKEVMKNFAEEVDKQVEDAEVAQELTAEELAAFEKFVAEQEK
eukprot:CAMPEP_0184751588 /NCGR_PEP_ID=MMETSP0315-20130426/43127_1 /TAXON_ID=101924 /ORGANISM="Rhodosorus marinus, Strain UTEX LB 2760" /LENGTH=108 /DNA_ID=CAMNT_0027230861 /DNA_START=203 /DNA_END=529 /DNA_ORIENTATION=-